MERAKKILTQALIAFVLISVGFALGKHAARKGGSLANQLVEQGDYVAVYYMHSTFRCVTCSTIEQMTRALLDKSYAKELKAGQVKWQDINFQENEVLARQFEIIASCVVVAQVKNGAVVDYKRLDEVWTLLNKPEEFDKCIGDVVNEYLGRAGGQR